MSDPTPEALRKALDAAYRLLARRAHSVAEIESKLADRKFSPVVISRAIDRLTSEGYLDDGAFARSFARHLMEHRPMGRRRMTWELRQKGVGKGLVEEAVEEVWAGRSELEVAKDVALRRLKAYRGLDAPTIRRRLKGYLERRGFPYGDIAEVVRELTSS